MCLKIYIIIHTGGFCFVPGGFCSVPDGFWSVLLGSHFSICAKPQTYTQMAHTVLHLVLDLAFKLLIGLSVLGSRQS